MDCKIASIFRISLDFIINLMTWLLICFCIVFLNSVLSVFTFRQVSLLAHREFVRYSVRFLYSAPTNQLMYKQVSGLSQPFTVFDLLRPF
jgi:hypothetical protein